MKRFFLFPLAAALLAAAATSARAQQTPAPVAPVGAAPHPATEPWQKLPTDPYRGKQDDIFFINPQVGWYVNGAGNIYKTGDGGAVWTKLLAKPGTYFRCIGFADEKHGWAGNIGTDYFPGVTDTTPLYETRMGARRGRRSRFPEQR